MFGMSVTIRDEVERVRRAAKDASRKSLNRTAFLIRKTAVESVERAEGPSMPGQPPHTHKGNWLRRAIRYSADRTTAVIGPMRSVFGTAGQAHEFGGQFRGQEYPARPFMGPALEKNLDIFAGSWSGSISR